MTLFNVTMLVGRGSESVFRKSISCRRRRQSIVSNYSLSVGLVALQLVTAKSHITHVYLQLDLASPRSSIRHKHYRSLVIIVDINGRREQSGVQLKHFGWFSQPMIKCYQIQRRHHLSIHHKDQWSIIIVDINKQGEQSGTVQALRLTFVVQCKLNRLSDFFIYD